MKTKSLLALFALFAWLSIFNPATAQTNATKTAKVVFQVSDADPAKWNLALNNANNAQQEFGASHVDIEVVAYGPGIGMLKADAVTSNRVAEATKGGIKVVACENTMRGQKLVKEDMNPAISFVPSGVGELIKRQGEGWAYIRP